MKKFLKVSLAALAFLIIGASVATTAYADGVDDPEKGDTLPWNR
ncbi:hypothetical protein [Enterococcus nangangensis]|nr:hypothetical protein [Enterococcus nangangensis]